MIDPDNKSITISNLDFKQAFLSWKSGSRSRISALRTAKVNEQGQEVSSTALVSPSDSYFTNPLSSSRIGTGRIARYLV